MSGVGEIFLVMGFFWAGFGLLGSAHYPHESNTLINEVPLPWLKVHHHPHPNRHLRAHQGFNLVKTLVNKAEISLIGQI